jgi:hypothetical protein
MHHHVWLIWGFEGWHQIPGLLPQPSSGWDYRHSPAKLFFFNSSKTSSSKKELKIFLCKIYFIF